MKAIFIFLILSAVSISANQKIYTISGAPEFDRSAAGWLLQKYKFKNAEIIFADKTNIPANALSFDFPDAKIERSGNQTAFESVIRYLKIKDDILNKMIPILRDIEINKWGKKKTEEAPGIIVIHNGFVFSGKSPKEIMKADWQILDALYNYFKKTQKK